MAYDNRTIVLLLLNIKKRSCGEKQSQGGTILAFSWRLIAFVLLSSSDVKIETIFFLVLSSSRTFFVHFQQKSNFCPSVICEQMSQYAQGKTFSFGGVKCMPNCIWDNYATEMDCVHCSLHLENLKDSQECGSQNELSKHFSVLFLLHSYIDHLHTILKV